jgi:chromate reductase
MRVLGISGSLRDGSLNTALLRTAGERLPAGVELVEYRGLAEVPPYDEDRDPSSSGGLEGAALPQAVRELREAILAADAVLVVTPEYNHSVPGQLKNALDWVSRPAGQSALNGKPAAAIGASRSMFGGVWAQAEMRKVLSSMGGRVVDAELGIAHAHEHLREGVGSPPAARIELDRGQEERLEEILAELVSAAERESGLVAA